MRHGIESSEAETGKCSQSVYSYTGTARIAKEDTSLTTQIKHVATNTLAATKQRLLLNITFQISIPTKLSAEPVHVITVAAGKEFEEYMVCEDNLELMHQRIMNKVSWILL